MKRLAILITVGLAILAGWCAPASADTAVIPTTDVLPWANPNHQTPLEQVASQIASEIAGRQVSVYCYDDSGWGVSRGGWFADGRSRSRYSTRRTKLDPRLFPLSAMMPGSGQSM